MHWRKKAFLQNALSRLPSEFSYSAYYWLQRKFGRLRNIDPARRLKAGVNVIKAILEQGDTPVGKTFFELGTGRIPIVPIAYWLMGADKTITVDLNRYMKPALLLEALQALRSKPDLFVEIFEGLADDARLKSLLAHPLISVSDARSLLALCNIDYRAPSDASKTLLPDASVDFHTSYTVLEHIPLPVLRDIFFEGSRILKHTGLFIHRIDYSDHFSHSDQSISPINFLQFSDDCGHACG